MKSYKGKKTVLGKGMAALIQASQKKPSDLGGESGSEEPLTLPIEKINANKNQPRKNFKERELLELSLSIKENGIIQPLIVREISGGEYEIIAGERRFRAAQKVGLTRVPVVIKQTTEKETMLMAIIENVQRDDLNCVEEAWAYYNLLNEFELTQEEVAKKIGKDRSTIANFLRLLRVPKEVLELLRNGDLSFGHGKVLASIKEEKTCLHYAKKAARENMSVRQLESLVKGEKARRAKKRGIEIFDAKLDYLKRDLENHTGFHIQIKKNAKGSGEVKLKFSNMDELNSIIDFIKK